MKQIILISLLLFILSCRKDDMPIYSPGNMEHGSVSACRNGKNWEASGAAYRYAERDSIFQLSGTTYTYDGIPREGWGISEIPLQIGSYSVYRYPFVGGFIGKPTAGFYIITSDGDVLEDTYRIDEDCNNYVKVTALDTVANKVAGCFELHFVVQQPKSGEQNSEEVCFKKGTFEVDIVE